MPLTTGPVGLPFPGPTDPPNVPGDIQLLAQAVADRMHRAFACTEVTKPVGLGTGGRGFLIQNGTTGNLEQWTGTAWEELGGAPTDGGGAPVAGGRIVGRNTRNTHRTMSNENLTRIMAASAPIQPGRGYRVSAHAEMYSASAGQCVVQADLRYTLDGTEAGVSSTLLNRWVGRQMANGSLPITLSPWGIINPAGAGPLNVVLCVLAFEIEGPYEVGGTSSYPAEVVIEDVGAAVTPVGTIYN